MNVTLTMMIICNHLLRTGKQKKRKRANVKKLNKKKEYPSTVGI